MPIYDFECTNYKCRRREERFIKMHHGIQYCPDCRMAMQKVFGVAPQYHAFREGWYEHIAESPIYVTSKKQLRHETRTRGLTSEYAED